MTIRRSALVWLLLGFAFPLAQLDSSAQPPEASRRSVSLARFSSNTTGSVVCTKDGSNRSGLDLARTSGCAVPTGWVWSAPYNSVPFVWQSPQPSPMCELFRVYPTRAPPFRQI